MRTHWYALRSKPHKERALFEQALSRGIEAFYPQVRVNPVNPRAAKVRPYFPGYLFVRADLRELGNSAFQWIPFSYGLVSFGGEPATVPDGLIAGLRQRLGEIEAAGGLKFDELKAGERVRVTGGPFRGYEGIYDAQLSGSERVRILLQLLGNHCVPLELQVGQITAINRAC